MNQNDLLILITVSFFIIIVFSIIRRLRKKRTRFEIIDVETSDELSKMLEIKKELDKLHDDIILIINRGIARMDSRIKEMNELLMVSDEKILFLNSLMEESEGRLNLLEKKLSALEEKKIQDFLKFETDISKVEISSSKMEKL